MLCPQRGDHAPCRRKVRWVHQIFNQLGRGRARSGCDPLRQCGPILSWMGAESIDAIDRLRGSRVPRGMARRCFSRLRDSSVLRPSLGDLSLYLTPNNPPTFEYLLRLICLSPLKGRDASQYALIMPTNHLEISTSRRFRFTMLGPKGRKPHI